MIKQIISTLGTKSVTAFLNFLIVIITARTLGADGRGEISLIVTSIIIIMMFTNLIGGTTLIYATPRHNVSDLILSSYLWAFFFSSASYIFLRIVPIFSKETVIHLFFLSLILSITTVNLNILIGKGKIHLSNLINLIQILIHFIIIGLLFYGFNYRDVNYFILSLYVSFGIALLVSVFNLREYFSPGISSSVLAVGIIAFKYGFVSQLANIGQFLNYRISYFLLNHFTRIEDLGMYSTGSSISEAVWLIGTSIAVVLYSRISNSDDIKASVRLTNQLAKISLMFSFAALIPLLILPLEFYLFIFGREFIKLKEVILILSPGILSIGFSVIFNNYFAGIGKYYINALISLAGLIISVILNIILIPEFGIKGAALVSAISYFAMSVLLFILYLKHSGTKAVELIPGIADIKFLKTNFYGMYVRNSRYSKSQ